jgi:hypothetical protein
MNLRCSFLHVFLEFFFIKDQLLLFGKGWVEINHLACLALPEVLFRSPPIHELPFDGL